jgi:acyl-CoA dehydrogenase
MDFDLPPEIAEMQRVTREMANSLLAYEPEFLETGKVPVEVSRTLVGQGYYGLTFPEEYGGMDLGALASVVVQAELSRLPPQFWEQMRSLLGPASKALLYHGTKVQKDRWLPKMVSGKCPVAFAVTEADAGSDVGAIKTRAVRDGDSWVLNGTKTFISNAGHAELFTVFAYTDRAAGMKNGISAFLVEKGTPGFAVSNLIKLMGTSNDGVGELVFDDCRIPAENLVGEEGRGLAYAMEGLNVGRIAIGAKALGMGELALEQAMAYAKQRIAFGKPIAGYQAIQHMLADMAVEMYACRQIVHEAAWRYDQGERSVQKCSMVKLFCSEAACRTVDKALQIFGGAGYMRGTIIERLYRDVRVMRIYEGSSEIQRNQIARQLLR